MNNIFLRFHCTLHDNVRDLKDVEAPFLDPLAAVNSGLSYVPGKGAHFCSGTKLSFNFLVLLEEVLRKTGTLTDTFGSVGAHRVLH